MRRTKIICTLGPSVDDIAVFQELAKTGFDVARLNFSHGSFEEHNKRIEMIKEYNDKNAENIAILLDTKGPEIRTGIADEKVELEKDEQIILTTKNVKSSKKMISISYVNLPKEVSIGDEILLDDGLIALKVLSVKNEEIICKILNSGLLGSKKGVNLPEVDVKLPSISEKDKQDILFGIEKGVNFIALSFVRRAEDILEVRKIIGKENKKIQIIAKIECGLAVKNIDSILEASDGVMIARGDLGVEIPIKELPAIQKSIIQKARIIGKPVIVATQMLDSMIRNPRPTRAEVSDIANSILDGTDAIMLSGETASGLFPIDSLRTMNEIAIEIEKDLHILEPMHFKKLKKSESIVDLIAYSTVDIGRKIDAKCLVVPTSSGGTARRVARHRPNIPIIALVAKDYLIKHLKLVWGVETIYMKEDYEGTDQLITRGEEELLKQGIYKENDIVIITAGIPLKQAGTTNLIKVHYLGG
ncbi:MAG: pyruvate kinase [Firmicutes bacterium]|nr:pyruvate kinase [Bacillota bacterium]